MDFSSRSRSCRSFRTTSAWQFLMSQARRRGAGILACSSWFRAALAESKVGHLCLVSATDSFGQDRPAGVAVQPPYVVDLVSVQSASLESGASVLGTLSISLRRPRLPPGGSWPGRLPPPPVGPGHLFLRGIGRRLCSRRSGGRSRYFSLRGTGVRPVSTDARVDARLTPEGRSPGPHLDLIGSSLGRKWPPIPRSFHRSSWQES